MKNLLMIGALAIATACASNKQHLVHEEIDPKTGVMTKDTTDNHTYTFWDSKNTIDKQKTSNGITKAGRSQTTGFNGLNEESSSTNTTDSLVRGLQIIGAHAP